MLKLRDIEVRVGRRVLVEGISLTVAPGEVFGIIGPRDTGKATLRRVLAGEVSPSRGCVQLGDTSLAQKSLPELARQLACVAPAWMPQPSLSVLEVVVMGRTPHRARESHAMGVQIAREAMAFTGVRRLADRLYESLSTEEQYQIELARALSQIWEPKASGDRLLVLDEPSVDLDVRDQRAALDCARRFASTGAMVVVLLRALAFATRCADRLLILESGRAVASSLRGHGVTDAGVHPGLGRVSAR